jgi:peptide deformylase
MYDLRIRTHPDPILRQKSQKVSSVGEGEKKLLDYMVETMYANQGIGLAAVQVGITKRMIVIDAGEGVLKMVNPEITSASGSSVLEEGCLSVPGKLVSVVRPERIRVSYIDENNTPKENEFASLTSKAIQHEIDHLNGKIILDYLPWYHRIFPKRGEVQCLQ